MVPKHLVLVPYWLRQIFKIWACSRWNWDRDWIWGIFIPIFVKYVLFFHHWLWKETNLDHNEFKIGKKRTVSSSRFFFAKAWIYIPLFIKLPIESYIFRSVVLWKMHWYSFESTDDGHLTRITRTQQLLLKTRKNVGTNQTLTPKMSGYLTDDYHLRNRGLRREQSKCKSSSAKYHLDTLFFWSLGKRKCQSETARILDALSLW